ncbi:MAG: hypothetical protein ACTSU5_13460 [Promethearchaeota archaeon]
MQVYGLFVCAANGMPLLTYVNDDEDLLDPTGSPNPVVWGEESHKLIGGFVSAMNLFCEEMVRKKNDSMRVAIDGLSLTTLARDIQQDSRSPSTENGKNWLDRLIFVLIHSGTSSRASEYLLRILVEKFFQVYERSWLSRLVAEGRVVFPEEADSKHFHDIYLDVVKKFRVKSEVTKLEVEFEL